MSLLSSLSSPPSFLSVKAWSFNIRTPISNVEVHRVYIIIDNITITSVQPQPACRGFASSRRDDGTKRDIALPPSGNDLRTVQSARSPCATAAATLGNSWTPVKATAISPSFDASLLAMPMNAPMLTTWSLLTSAGGVGVIASPGCKKLFLVSHPLLPRTTTFIGRPMPSMADVTAFTALLGSEPAAEHRHLRHENLWRSSAAADAQGVSITSAPQQERQKSKTRGFNAKKEIHGLLRKIGLRFTTLGRNP